MSRRVFLDKQQLHEVYNAFPDQRFYSVEYDGPLAQEVLDFCDKHREVMRWCRDTYFALQGGLKPPMPPEFLTEVTYNGATTQNEDAESGGSRRVSLGVRENRGGKAK